MKRETQALHLAKMMQNHIPDTRYELALPFVKVKSSKLKKLSLNDVWLLDLNVLEFVLLEGDLICADLLLQNVEGKTVIVVTNVAKKMIASNDHHKYETVKLSLGECYINSLELGNSLDVSQFNLDKIMVIVNEKKRAEGFLINVDNQIAVKINTLF
jgi:hypothetical protein